VSLTVTVSVSFVAEGEYHLTIPLAPSSGPGLGIEGRDDPYRGDKVLPLGSSMLSPGLYVPLAS